MCWPWSHSCFGCQGFSGIPPWPALSNLASPIKHSICNFVYLELLGAAGFLLTFVLGGVFGVALSWILRDSHQLLSFSHVQERDKALLSSVMVGGVWTGFLLWKVPGEVRGAGRGHASATDHAENVEVNQLGVNALEMQIVALCHRSLRKSTS